MVEQLPLPLAYSSDFERLGQLQGCFLQGAKTNGDGTILFILGIGHPLNPTGFHEVGELKIRKLLSETGTPNSDGLADLAEALRMTLEQSTNSHSRVTDIYARNQDPRQNYISDSP